ncbi:MAG: hypothetical protein KF892_23810 [Rhizobacter sp.]|nr:hypothetical protein [Rhizobacter sp.]
MNQLSKPSNVERVSGSVVTESALTVVAAVAGGPLAPLLPVLAKSLAAERQKKRVEAAISEIHGLLAEQSQRVATLSDEQYKVVNETVLAVLQTTQEEKIGLLRNAVANALTTDVGTGQEAIMVSRVIRDISAEEATFLFKAFVYEGIQPVTALPPQSASKDKVLRILATGSEYLNMSGLLSLGVLTPAESAWDGIGTMRFTAIAAKVIALLRSPDA